MIIECSDPGLADHWEPPLFFPDKLAGTPIGAGRPWIFEDYDFMKAKISALIVPACVVSMPCGKPL